MNHLPMLLGNNSWGHPKNVHSRKKCWCGGHNMRNVSRNLNHHGTITKLLIRKSRRLRNEHKI